LETVWAGSIVVTAVSGTERSGSAVVATVGGAFAERDTSRSSKAESAANCSGVAVEINAIMPDIVSFMLSPAGAHR
jgi:hypothetical protein